MLTQNPIKIMFILPSAKAGGAERVITTLANSINKKYFKAILLVVGHKIDSAYETSGIETIFLGKNRVLDAIPSILFQIGRLKPRIVMGSISHVNRVLSFASLLFPKVYFIGREASVSSTMNKYAIKKGKINYSKYFFNNYFNYLDAIICQSNDMYEDLIKENNIDTSKTIIINNPISDGFDLSKTKTKKSIIQYITVGSLHPVKGHRRLLKILSEVDHDFSYTIVGDGNEELIGDIDSLGLTEKITHVKYTNRVMDLLRSADVFLCGSYVEGFPNAIIESCSVGVPFLAFNVPGGLKEIVIDGINGCVVENEIEFIEKLNDINKCYPFDPAKVNKTVVPRYSKDVIVSKYEQLFANVIKNAPLK